MRDNNKMQLTRSGHSRWRPSQLILVLGGPQIDGRWRNTVTRREGILTVAFMTLLAGLLLGTVSGRLFLTQPVAIGLTAPRWLVWTGVALAYVASTRLQPRWLRVAVAYGLAH